MLNFIFLEKGLGLVPPLTYDFESYVISTFEKKKKLLKLYSVNWLNVIIWVPLLLEIWDNMCIVIIPLSLMTSKN